MSYEQDYFPPRQDYGWLPKPLSYSPWALPYWDSWPARLFATVSLHDGLYHWRADVCGWRHERRVIEGSTKTAFEACLAAEKVLAKEKEKLLPPWVVEALANGWRPPG